MIEDVLPFINMVEILLCDLCEHYWPVIFKLLQRKMRRLHSREDVFKIGLVPGREKKTLYEDIQNKEYIACFHSTINP